MPGPVGSRDESQTLFSGSSPSTNVYFYSLTDGCNSVLIINYSIIGHDFPMKLYTWQLLVLGLSRWQRFRGSEGHHLCSDLLNSHLWPSLHCFLCRGQSWGLLSLEASGTVPAPSRTDGMGWDFSLPVFKTKQPGGPSNSIGGGIWGSETGVGRRVLNLSIPAPRINQFIKPRWTRAWMGGCSSSLERVMI